MSKKVNAAVQCAHCSHKWEQEIYRSLWVEYPENMELVMSDDIFKLTCPSCAHVEDVAYTFLATNVERSYAVWFEPVPDEGIDADCQLYASMFGPENFYSEAPRIKNWEEFKVVLGKYDRGELKGTPVDAQKMMAAYARMPVPSNKVERGSKPGFIDRLKRLFNG